MEIKRPFQGQHNKIKENDIFHANQNWKVGLMRKNAQNSAVIADIFMKFGTKVLNWTLNNATNFY